MDIFENAIMRYVATDRSTFVIPQYDIEQDNTDQSWASLDFLGIHSGRKRIYIIEVTSASNFRGLLKKVKDMFELGKHVEKLKRQLHKDYGDQYDTWPIHVAVFIRETLTRTFNEHVAAAGLTERVHVFAIEECIFPWKYYEWVMGPDRSWDAPKAR